MRKSLCLAVLSLASLLAGCTSGVNTLVTTAAKSSGMSGSVHGGAQPVSGATIQIYAPGTTGYGSAATPLLGGAPLLTGTDGGFYFGDRSLVCPSGAGGHDRLYMTATGGNPGFGSAVNNDALFLMTIIDDCQSLSASSFFSISEVSTVASIYALSQFMSSSTGSIGTYGSSITGLNNAFDLAVTLFNPATGTAYALTPNGIGQVPQRTIDTLANIITPCVNSTGSSSPACTALFQSTVNTVTSNTGLATRFIAQNPGSNVAALYAQANANAPFQPALTSAPNDLTLAVSYHTGASVPSGLAIDSSGNVWVSDFNTGGGTSKLYKFTPSMVAASGSPYNAVGITSLAIDSSDNVWAIDPADNQVQEFNNSGSGITALTATRGGGTAQALAIDAAGNPWVSENGTAIDEIHLPSLNTVSYTGSFSSPSSIVFDNTGNGWVPNSGANSIAKISGGGATLGTYTGGGLGNPAAAAIDNQSNIYVGNTSGGNLSEFSSTGAPISATGYNYPSVGNSSAVATDGIGRVWSAGANNLLSALYNGSLLSPATGYQAPGINAPGNIAIDASGNVWVLDKTHISLNGTFVNLTNFVGLATPAITPLAAAVRSGQVGSQAGTPIPVAINTTALPYYTTGTAYTATLHASGGSGAYTWTSGTLPTGLSLSSAGVITGTPTGSAATVNFTVTDSNLASNASTRTITFGPLASLPSGANTANLSGQFAVLIKGFRTGTLSTTGAVNGYGVIGSLTFDGAGHITGAMDYNGSNGSALNQSMTGTYTVGSDLRGFMLLTNGATSGNASIPKQLAFSVANSYKTLYLTEFDSTTPTGQLASGIAKLQTPSQFTGTTMNQKWVFGLDGETTCVASGSSCGTSTSSYYGAISVAGQIAINSIPSISGAADFATINHSYPNTVLTGSYNVPSVTIGRGSMQLPVATSVFPNYGSLFLYYVVNSNEVFLMTALSHTTVDLLIGDMIVQTQTFSATPSANASIFTGNYLIEQNATYGGDGTAKFPRYSDSFVVLANSVGSGTLSATQDENQAGLITTASSLGSLPYSIDANGRMTLTGGPVALYLADGTGGFGTELPTASNNGAPGLLTVEQQSGTSLACSTLSGSYSFGSPASTTSQDISSGSVVFTGTTAVATIDTAKNDGTLSYGASGNLTCSADANTPTLGRLNYTDSSGHTNVGYIVSPSKMILLDNNATSTNGSLQIIVKQ